MWAFDTVCLQPWSIPKFICKFFFLIQDTFSHGKKFQMAFRIPGLSIKVYFLHNTAGKNAFAMHKSGSE